MTDQSLRALESAFISFVTVFVFTPMALVIYIHSATGSPLNQSMPLMSVPMESPFVVCVALALMLCCAPVKLGRVTLAAIVLMPLAAGICAYKGATETRFEVAELAGTHEQIVIVWDGGDTVYGEVLDPPNRMSGKFVTIPNPERDLGRRRVVTVQR